MTEENSNKIKGTNLSLMQFALLLLVSSSIVRLASSLYLPSLIEIGKTLNLSESLLSSTLTVFFVAFAFSMLFAGPLADRYGRKRIIIAGCIIFIFGSLLCALANSATTLFAGRILQAIGASGIPVAGRAMIRDLCSDIQVIKVLGWMAAIGGLVPIVAPMLGGVINDVLGWRYNFWLLDIFSLLAGLVIIIKLPHSMKPENARALHIPLIFKTYLEMITSPEFIVVILPLMLAFAIQGAYLATSPFIFMKRFGLSGIQYGVVNLAIVTSLVAGRFIATGMSKRLSDYAAYVVGALLPLMGGMLLLLVIYLRLTSIPTVLVAFSIAVTGFGTLLPIGIKSIMTAFRDRAGTASALYGCLTLGMTSTGCFVVTIIKRNLHLSSLSGLALFTVTIGVVILVSGLMTKKYLR